MVLIISIFFIKVEFIVQSQFSIEIEIKKRNNQGLLFLITRHESVARRHSEYPV